MVTLGAQEQNGNVFSRSDPVRPRACRHVVRDRGRRLPRMPNPAWRAGKMRFRREASPWKPAHPCRCRSRAGAIPPWAGFWLTPAHAGHTPSGSTLPTFHGSPPRVRGRFQRWPSPGIAGRPTPARAGKTSGIGMRHRPDPVHPHECGEHGHGVSARHVSDGALPRVRGTSRWPRRPAWPAVHPRVCGEDYFDDPLHYMEVGSPPPVWGKRSHVRPEHPEGRFTPAGAGKER